MTERIYNLFNFRDLGGYRLKNGGTTKHGAIAQDAYHPHVREDVREAFEAACATTNVSEPVDWLETRTPQVWKSVHGTDNYNW